LALRAVGFYGVSSKLFS